MQKNRKDKKTIWSEYKKLYGKKTSMKFLKILYEVVNKYDEALRQLAKM